MAAIKFTSSHYSPTTTLGEPYESGIAFPLSLSPAGGANVSASDLAHAIRRQSEEGGGKGEIHDLLGKHGAIYFQGLGLKTAAEFSDFAHAFGWTPHEDIGNPVRRTVLARNVATANEGPNTQPVYPHNEFGLSPHYPAYVLFFCAEPPSSGK